MVMQAVMCDEEGCEREATKQFSVTDSLVFMCDDHEMEWVEMEPLQCVRCFHEVDALYDLSTSFEVLCSECYPKEDRR